MSNFICSECGMTNIDCGHAGYKTPKEIELEKKVHILNESNMKLENELGHFADLSKKVGHLQKQLADANKTIDYYDKKDFHYTLADGTVMGAEPAHKYKIKWGVK